MHFDVPAQLGAVSRIVDGRTDADGRPLRVVAASRSYDTSIEDVWDALTNPERIPRWFLPVSGELRLGGRYQLEGNAGGEILECDPPAKLALSWEFGGQTSRVQVALTATADTLTHLELEHVAEVPEEFWMLYGPGAVGIGWELGLLGLDSHLRTGQAVSPEQSEAWQRSDNGRAFIVGSSRLWAEAAIAGDAFDTREEADQAAERTTAFYCGEDG